MVGMTGRPETSMSSAPKAGDVHDARAILRADKVAGDDIAVVLLTG